MLNSILFSVGSENFIKGLGISLAGLAIVFVVLLLICGILYLFGKLFYKKPEEKAVVPAVLPEVKTVSEPAPAEADEGELVAAITAAIACVLQTGTDGFVVRSFRRIGRKNNGRN